MATVVTGSIPFTELPFQQEEYDRRLAAVLAKFPEFEVDALAVTSQMHHRYLSGYIGGGAYFAPFPLILAPAKPPTFVVRELDEISVRAYGCVTEVATYKQESDCAKAWADTLRSLGLERSRLGLELGCWGLTPWDVEQLRALLPELRIVDATRLVASVSDIKSPVEIAVMRQAMKLTRLAVETFYEELREGVTEATVLSKVERTVVDAGSDTGISTLLFGPRAALPHAPSTPYALSRGDVAFLEIAGWSHGYAAGLIRTATLGENREAAELHRVAEVGQEAALAVIKPGVTAGEVDAAHRRAVASLGRKDNFRHRAGYCIGLGWLDRGNLSLEPNSKEILQPGMTLHLLATLIDPGRLHVGCSETVLVTDTGVEVLSGIPRELRAVG